MGLSHARTMKKHFLRTLWNSSNLCNIFCTHILVSELVGSCTAIYSVVFSGIEMMCVCLYATCTAGAKHVQQCWLWVYGYIFLPHKYYYVNTIHIRVPVALVCGTVKFVKNVFKSRWCDDDGYLYETRHMYSWLWCVAAFWCFSFIFTTGPQL